MLERFKTFTVLIANLSRNIRRIKSEEMAKWNLKTNHVSCLYYLYVHKHLTSKQLCDICNEDKANVSRSIDYLKENGYVSCVEENQKRYKSPYALTEKGTLIAKKLYERVQAILTEASAGITDAEREIMYRCLEIINDNLQNELS